MPIVTVELVLRPAETTGAGLAAALADGMGEVFGSAPGGTWVKVRRIAADDYAENGGKQKGVYPVFVSVLKARVPPPEALTAEVAAVIATVAAICSRPVANVHVVYLPPGAGRVAFGGELVGN